MQKRQLPNGKWQFTEGYKDKNGKYRRITVVKPNKTRASEKEAYEELQEKIRKKLEDKVELKTIGFYKEEFFQIKKNSVSINTLTSYEGCLKLLDDDINISDITKPEYEKKLIEYRETYSPNHVKLIKTIFNIFFKFIKSYYVPTFDVVLEFTLSKEDKFKEKQKIKYIETNKIQEVLESITHPITKDFVTVQLLTGLRVGELLAITPNDIDVKNKTLSVNKTKHTSGIFTSPKTISSVRTIEINDRTLEILMRYMSASKTLFNTTIPTLNYNLKNVKLTTHMFRHTHVALLVEAGVPIKVISERLGHSKIDTTLDIYTHVTENMKLDLRTKLNNLCADFTQK
nr:MAG TPA: Integrase [Caudoviricetes sp.]